MIDAVRFGNIHSYRDLGLVLTSKEVSAPSPKTYYVDIDGADGQLDFTDAFGTVKYEEREISLKFSWLTPSTDYLKKWSEIQNLLHGMKFRITFDSDPDFYYIGRCDLNKWTLDKVIGSFTVKVSAEPYKYHREVTVITEEIQGSKTFVLKNDRKQVMPIFHASARMTIAMNGDAVTIEAGQSGYNSSLILSAGNTFVTVEGTGTLTITYQEGSL